MQVPNATVIKFDNIQVTLAMSCFIGLLINKYLSKQVQIVTLPRTQGAMCHLKPQSSCSNNSMCITNQMTKWSFYFSFFPFCKCDVSSFQQQLQQQLLLLDVQQQQQNDNKTIVNFPVIVVTLHSYHVLCVATTTTDDNIILLFYES